MNDFIEALKEIKKESKDFKITLYRNEVLEITNEIERLNNIINEFENRLKRRIKAYEDRQALGKGYELTNVMEIQLTIDRKYLKELQELKEKE